MAWNIDADQIKIRDVNTQQLSDHIVVNEEIRSFLKIGESDYKFFISAPKGLGKTLLLKVKSQLYRDKHQGFKFIPEEELCEKFTNIGTSFSKREIASFSNREIWIKVWEICLLALILRHFDIELPKPLAGVIAKAHRLPDILGSILSRRGKVASLHRLVHTHLRPMVRDLRTEAKVGQLAIFIDNIDEALEEHTGYSLLYPEAGSSALSEQVWVNAQLGILRAAKDICISNKHIKIFVTVRSEALTSNSDTTSLQLEAYTTHLSYSKRELEEIFEHNIRTTPASKLAKPGAASSIERFLGFEELPHRFVLGTDDKPRVERAFDFIYRHTFGRPREIVEVGGKIAKMPVRERAPEQIVDLVNTEAGRLFSQYKKEIVPYFRDDLFDFLCDELKTNVFSYEQAHRIYLSAIEKMDYEHILSYFYRMGLIGVVENDRQEDFEGVAFAQRFLPVGDSLLLDRKVPDAPDFFVVHPALDRSFSAKHDTAFWNRDNIIGYDYDFQYPHRKTEISRHVHFGLDRDSLSVISPAFVKEKALAIVQPPSQDWVQIYGCGQVVLRVTGDKAIIFRIVTDRSSNAEIERWLREWGEGRPLIVFTGQDHLVARVLAQATTVSLPNSSVEALERALKLQKPDRSFLRLAYLCERYSSPKDYKFLRRALTEAGFDNVAVESMLIDRYVFSPPSIKTTNGEARISIKAENRSSIIFRNRPLLTLQASSTVRPTASKNEQEFYSKKHKLLLEGVYRLCKIARFRSLEREVGKQQYFCIFELFYFIQVERLLRSVKPIHWRLIFPSRTQSEVTTELTQYCQEVRERVMRIPKDYNRPVTGRFAHYSRSQGIFPRKKDFYEIVRQSKMFLETRAVLALRDLLQVSDRDDLCSVFISYSFRDENFASKLNSCLQKRGVSTFLFQQDDPHRSIKKIMSSEIDARDRLVFLASRSSISSPACQFELSRCRKKLQRDWRSILVPLRLDNYVLDVEEHEIPAESREEYWSNIEMLREQNLRDYSTHKATDPDRAFELEIDKLVEETLTRRA